MINESVDADADSSTRRFFPSVVRQPTHGTDAHTPEKSPRVHNRPNASRNVAERRVNVKPNPSAPVTLCASVTPRTEASAGPSFFRARGHQFGWFGFYSIYCLIYVLYVYGRRQRIDDNDKISSRFGFVFDAKRSRMRSFPFRALRGKKMGGDLFVNFRILSRII